MSAKDSHGFIGHIYIIYVVNIRFSMNIENAEHIIRKVLAPASDIVHSYFVKTDLGFLI